jgi:hypothetical protein
MEMGKLSSLVTMGMCGMYGGRSVTMDSTAGDTGTKQCR